MVPEWNLPFHFSGAQPGLKQKQSAIVLCFAHNLPAFPHIAPCIMRAEWHNSPVCLKDFFNRFYFRSFKAEVFKQVFNE